MINSCGLPGWLQVCLQAKGKSILFMLNIYQNICEKFTIGPIELSEPLIKGASGNPGYVASADL